MSSAIEAINKPTTRDMGIDLSVTELLELLKKSGVVDTAQVNAPEDNTSVWVYADVVREKQPQFDIARAIAAVCPAAAKYVQRMEASLDKGADADGKNEPEDAKKHLQRAIFNANLTGVAVKRDFDGQKAVIEAPLAGIEARINRLQQLDPKPPPHVVRVLDAAKNAQTNARPPVGDAPDDWRTAFASLATLKDAIDAIGQACLREAKNWPQYFDSKFKKAEVAGSDFVDRRAAYKEARKDLDAVIATGDGLTALERVPAVDALLEKLLLNAPVARQLVRSAMTTLTGLNDKQLADKTMLEKAEIALDLCARGLPTDKAQLKQLVRLYNKSKPDQQFMDKRAQQRDQIVDELLKLPEVSALFDKNGKVDTKAWKKLVANGDHLFAALTKVSYIQCDTLDMPRVPIKLTRLKRKIKITDFTSGQFDPATNQVEINTDPLALWTAKSTLNTVIHEIFHAHQHYMIELLLAGDIKPDNPDYPMVVMWFVNSEFNVTDVVSHKDYMRQPIEFDSFYNADNAMNSLLIKAKQNAKGEASAGGGGQAEGIVT
jgi:hypothetical protein